MPEKTFKSLADVADVAPDLAATMERIYAWRRCASLACNLSWNADLPVMVLDCPGDLGHVAVVVDRSTPSPDDWLVADIMGVRTVKEVRAVYEDKMGRLDLRFLDDPEDGGVLPLYPDEPTEAMLLLAGRCPWLRDLVPEEFRQTDDSRVLAEMQAIMDALSGDFYDGARRWRQTNDLVNRMLDEADEPPPPETGPRFG